MRVSVDVSNARNGSGLVPQMSVGLRPPTQQEETKDHGPAVPRPLHFSMSLQPQAQEVRIPLIKNLDRLQSCSPSFETRQNKSYDRENFSQNGAKDDDEDSDICSSSSE